LSISNGDDPSFWARFLKWTISAADRSRPSVAAVENPAVAAINLANAAMVPTIRLTRKVNGKTTSESFATPAALRKAEREIAAFHHFRELSRELLEVNERICRARPVEDSLSPQEKKRQSISSANSAGALRSCSSIFAPS
jgi:hypothetical protein